VALQKYLAVLVVGIALAGPGAGAHAEDAKQSGSHDLAKQSQNPVANLIVVPFENNVNFGIGPEDATDNVLNLKPVIPIGIGDWNLINRPIVPIIYQEGRVPGQDDKFGLGDINYQGFFTPANPGPVIWGLGPSIVIPTHTSSRLGVDKWSAGPAAVTLVTPGKWVIGALAQNVWSFAGDSDAPKVNQFLVSQNDAGHHLRLGGRQRRQVDGSRRRRVRAAVQGRHTTHRHQHPRVLERR
jgi:hypothetical protein